MGMSEKTEALVQKIVANELCERDILNNPKEVLQLLKKNWCEDLKFFTEVKGNNIMLGVGNIIKQDDIPKVQTKMNNLMVSIVDKLSVHKVGEAMQMIYDARNTPYIYSLIMTWLQDSLILKTSQMDGESCNDPDCEVCNSTNETVH
jgi:hypothetical protein